MKKNMGTMDKAIRIIAAVLVVALYFSNVISGFWAIILLIVSGVFIATSFMSFCPLYFIFRISTNKKSPEPDGENS